VSIRIIDFGLSIKTDQKQFKEWSRIGSLFFLAPEVFRGIYSTKCDVWSCGVVIHMLLLGVNPFFEAEEEDVQKKVNNY
jgi:calcium-dependent protein kinase